MRIPLRSTRMHSILKISTTALFLPLNMTHSDKERTERIQESFFAKIKLKAKEERKQNRLKAIHSREKFVGRFLRMQMASDLCKLVKEDYNSLNEMINRPNYHSFTIPKKSGGKREISAPDKRLLRVQKKLNRYLQFVYLGIRPAAVHGFVMQVSDGSIQANIVENAKAHVGKRAVLSIDLVDFFPSISAKSVKELFMRAPFNFNDQIAIPLALLMTSERKLPQGAPTSPVISNFICLQLDETLRIWAMNHNATYTRYADDLTFSADIAFSEEQQAELSKLIEAFGFVINEKKLRQRLKNRRQTVTGLTVNTKVNVDRRYLKRIRAMLHDLKTNGIEEATIRHFKLVRRASPEHRLLFVNRLEGSIAFIGQVRGQSDPIYQRMLKSFFDMRSSK
jgi:RNA-directed DNA polymerase